MHKHVGRLVFGAVVLLAFCLLSNPALASLYGRGLYGDCGYDECAASSTSSGGTTAPPTKATLPSGLEISINLTNGQKIPYNGYTVIITPLNGQGSSFDHVEIYIDDKLAATVSPESTGTARWQWDTQKLPGSSVKIIVYGTGGNTITREFSVSIEPKPSPATTSTGRTNPESEGGILQQTYGQIQEFIRALPKPVVYSFPYLLFILLAVNLVLLLLQIKCELREYRLLRARLDRERAAAEAKRTLLELVSHYLRTPFTVIQGGIGLLQKNDLVQSDMINLNNVTRKLQTSIEQVITEMRLLSTATTATPQKLPVFWRQLGLILPIVLIGLLVIAFNILAERAGSFSANQVTIGIQLVIFLAVILGTYQVFRRLHLHRRDDQALRQIIAEEIRTNQARDEIIDRAYITLRDDFARLDTVADRLSNSPASKFIRAGQTDYRDLFLKFGVAAQLRGSRSTNAPTNTSWAAVAGKAIVSMQAKAKTKQISILDQTSDTPLQVQEPELLVFVLQTILDNALEYAPPGSSIEITASPQATGRPAISVTDHGPGIPLAKQSYLFQPFSKAEGAETFTHQGMGFSLYLDKLIMHYLGGTIELHSSEGQGAIVTIAL